MTVLNTAARQVIESGALAHLVTINDDGSPQVSVVWVGLDGDELVAGHLDSRQRKLRNIHRDPRVAVTFEASGANQIGMRDYLVIHGKARVTAGGAPELLHRLAQTYIGPGTVFPPMPDPPSGFVTHIAITRVAGSGPWLEFDTSTESH
jgi:PPOX class probable F420-dependent enzyme